MSNKPTHKITAKPKDGGDRIYFGAVWEGKFSAEGNHDLSLGARMKDDSGEWVDCEVVVTVTDPSGEVTELTKDGYFFNLFEAKPDF